MHGLATAVSLTRNFCQMTTGIVSINLKTFQNNSIACLQVRWSFATRRHCIAHWSRHIHG